jgi:uncharacterized protein (DUF2236 family)
MPREVAPASHAEFRSWYEERLAGPGLHLTEDARHVGSAIMFEIPVPPSRWPAMRVHNLIVLGSLPRRVRRLYGLPWSPAHAAAYRATVAAVRAPRPVTPRRLTTGRCTAHFDLVAATERGLIARGRPVPGALAW